MTFPSLAELPGLVMFLILFGVYPIRKVYPFGYRVYSFACIYYTQFALTIKVGYEIFVRIDCVEDYVTREGRSEDEKRWTEAFQAFYGRELRRSGSPDSGDDYIILLTYAVYIIACIFCCQGFKTAKWFEIRYKTKEMTNAEAGCCGIGRFWSYLVKREKLDANVQKRKKLM